MAINEPRIFLENFGVMAIITNTGTAPIVTTRGSMGIKIFEIRQSLLEMKSAGTLSIVSPKKGLSSAW